MSDIDSSIFLYTCNTTYH